MTCLRPEACMKVPSNDPKRNGSAAWSIGPVGPRFYSTSPGGALDTAIERFGPQAIVAIVEPLA